MFQYLCSSLFKHCLLVSTKIISAPGPSNPFTKLSYWLVNRSNQRPPSSTPSSISDTPLSTVYTDWSTSASRSFNESTCLSCLQWPIARKLERYLSWKNLNYILVWNANTNYKTSIESFTASNRGRSLLDHVLIRFIFLWTHPRPAHELAVHLVHIVQLDQCIRLLVRLVQLV